MHDEEVLGKPYDARLMRRILRYLRPYRASVALALVCIAMFSVLTSMGPYYSKQAIDRYLGGTSGHAAAHGAVERVLDRFLSSDPVTGVGQLALLYLLTLIAEFAVEYAQTYLLQLVGQRLMYDLRMEIFSHLQRLHLAYFDRNPVGRLVTRVTTDVNVLNETFTQGVVTIFGDVLTLAFIVLVMVRMNAPLAVAAFAVMPGILLVTKWFRGRVRDSFRRIRLAVARINSYLQEHITGMTVLQLFNREARSQEEFSRINDTHRRAYKDAIFAHALFYPAVELLSAAAIALILWYGGLRAYSGAVTFGVVVAFIQYAQRFYRPIMDLSEKYNVLQEAMASAERIFTLLDTPEEITSPAAPELAPNPRGRIEFRNVWFAYQKATGAEPEWVLRDVSFTIEPGQTIAVVGHTGAGKTTLISLLLRFYDVTRGEILVDGVDIRQMNLTALRHYFGVVLQDPFLFTGTVETNIRLGSAHVTREMMEEAAEEVNVSSFVFAMPKGFSTPVRERGATLSVGQKQLISFARALAHRPRVLILDEATSSVDTATEHKVREALETMVTGRTSLVIAHRLSTIQRADRILVFHKGQLRESGDHQTLLSHKGIYWKLYQLQFQ